MTGFKGIFSKFFGKESSSKNDSFEREEKRRNTRIGVSPEENLAVHLLEPGEGDVGKTLVASVINVSLTGLGIIFKSPEETARLKVGQSLVAAVEIEKFSVPLTVEVVRFLGKEGVGLKFKPPFPRELVQLEKFLEPRILGPSLREIKSDALQQGDEKILRWFQGANDTHLFSWASKLDGTILQQQLIFVERVIEWGRSIALRTGRVQSPGDSGTSGHYGWVRSEMLEFDPEPDRLLLRQVGNLLECSPVTGDIKNAFLKKIRECISE